MKELIVASRNKGKIAEIKSLLSGLPYHVTSLLEYPQLPDVVEDGTTYRANALKKAVEIAKLTKKLTISDDSGLEVKALGWAPGIYSARFAGHGASEAAKNKKLLQMLAHVPKNQRHARYRCVIAFVDEKGQEISIVQGICSGMIMREPQGDNGFGFDPLFYLNRYGKTFGQLPAALKAKISHRARALKKFRKIIEEYRVS